MMKYFVFADVHSFYTELMDALKKAGFDKNNPEHMLISCGDNFDRGSESDKMLDFLVDMKENNKIILVKGNHEDLLEEAIKMGCFCYEDFSNGLVRTLMTLLKKDGIIVDINDLLRDLNYYVKTSTSIQTLLSVSKSMLDYYETKNYIFTHGFLPITADANSKDILVPDWRNAPKGIWATARWTNGQKVILDGNVKLDKKVVVGHHWTSYGHVRLLYPELSDFERQKYEHYTKVSNYDIFEKDNLIAIDACTIISRKVNVLVVED